MSRIGVAVALAVGAAAAAGCVAPTAFECVAADACDDGEGGRCEADGRCSYADAACPDGRRYGPQAGTRAGECVAGDAGDDAGPTADARALDGGPAPDAAPVTVEQAVAAELRITIGSISGGTTYTLAHVADDGWGELAITWATKPAAGDPFTTLALTGSDDETPFVLDLTAAVAAEVAGDPGGPLSFVVTSSNAAYTDFYAGESTIPPTLAVTYLPAP